MKKTTVFLVICLFGFLPQFVYSQVSGYVEDEIIIHFADSLSEQQQLEFVAHLNGEIIDHYSSVDVLVRINSFDNIEGPNGEAIYNVVDIITSYEEDLEIDDLDLNYFVTPTPLSLDSLLEELDMENFSPVLESCLDDNHYPGGYLFGCEVPDSRGGAEDLFEIEEPQQMVKVAIIDTGLDNNDYNSFITQYVRAEVSTLNAGLLLSSGDQNSYGFDPTYAPLQGAEDFNGHGTSIAGIIAGLSQRAGFSSQDLGLYIIKAFNPEGKATLFQITKAVSVAIGYGVHLINMSWSYIPVPEDEGSQVLYELLNSLKPFGIHGTARAIGIAGAGNDNLSLDEVDVYPAGFVGIDRLITVGGVNCAGIRSSFSNYGNEVNLYAPAENIISPALDGLWRINNKGTSFAAPIVTAALIQVWRKYFPEGIPYNGLNSSVASVEDLNRIRRIIIDSAVEMEESKNLRILNFEAACEAATLNSPYSYSSKHAMQIAHNVLQSTQENKNILVFPNPFSSNFSVSFNRDENEDILTLEVLTLLGRKVLSKKWIENGVETIQVNLDNHVPKGIYILKIKKSGQIYTKTIVKK